MTDYPWYRIIDSPDLEQGDIIKNCPVIEPFWPDDTEITQEDSYDLTALQLEYDVIIMTQTCDLQNNKVETVLLCPIFPVEDITKYNWPDASQKEIRSLREKIRQGILPTYHMIAASEIQDYEHDIHIVTFDKVFSLPKPYIQEFIKQQNPRIRMLPPYREHLGQAFARFFMRVGLPIDIPKQK